MADREERLLDYLKRVTGDLRQTQRRLKDAESAAREPVAIVGMACRLPGGVSTPEDLWEVVTEGRDAVTGPPGDRGWDLDGLYHPDPEHPGTSYVREGGFVHDAGEFDAAFFGIGPAEALGMAPQQRLALELSWEAVERAGVDPRSLRSAPVGMFLGCDGFDYCLSATDVPPGSEGYFTIGNSASVTSGRVSYALGLEGPALTIATACSSSLVAVHLACGSLRRGESTLALAGGAHVMASPAPLIGFSEMRALAPDGRSKPFSAKADGMTLAEGAGVLLLERLSDARRNGHRVLAVIRGSAVNQDGASNGLTAPNGPSQERVIRAALADARLPASEVDAVEAHGTGTPLGDPIEAGALLATYGSDRPEGRPLWLGSVKSNIGHTQMSAGVAGVIKMVMAMRHGVLPATLHIDEPSGYVDWDTGGLRLLTEARPWSRTGRLRRAGVSSFGFSGTNAHLILEEAPEEEPDATPPHDGVLPWVLSARSAAALRAQAGRLRDVVADGSGPSAVEVGWSLLKTRTLFEHRAVVVGEDRAAALTALAEGMPHPSLAIGVTGSAGPGPVLVFPGQGSQWPGMGAALLDESPVFAARMAECEQALAPHVDWSLRDVIRGDGSELSRVDVVQPVLWAVMVSLAAVWADHGVKPAAVVGHSQGEIAAACVAGALSLDDAARVVALRSKALRKLAGGGAMASLGVGAEQAEALLTGEVTVAAVNSPSSTVVSGPPDQVAAVVASAQEQGLRARMIDVDYASHGPQVDQITGELRDVLAGVTASAGGPFYSTVTGERLDSTALDTEYWITNLRQPVRFTEAVGALLDDGHRVFIEASPHPVLTTALEETFEDGGGAAAVPTLRRDHGDLTQLALALARAFGVGASVDWARWYPTDPAPRVVELPTYPFQRQRYWVEHAATVPPGGGHDADEAALWQAIEDQDTAALAETLRLDGADLRSVLPALSQWRRAHRERQALNACRYRIGWKNVRVPAATGLEGTWLVLVPETHRDGPEAEVALRALDGHGATAVVQVVDASQVTKERLAAHLAEAEPRGVISLLGLDESPLERFEAVPSGLSATIRLVQAMADGGPDVPLWCLTRDAVATTASEPLGRPTQAQVWGLGRVAALEHPDLWGGLVDLPAELDRRAADRLASVLAPGQTEDQVALRASGVWARRLEHAPPAEDAPDGWRPTGTTLITGGTGGIGAYLARRLAANGAPHLILASRRGPDAPGASELAAELTALGTTVTVVACDAADRVQLEEALRKVPEDRPLTTVLHAAGILSHVPIAELTTEAVAEVLGPKSHAAAHLADLVRDHPVSTFLMFSSGAATWGSGQQGAYAAANHYLDALAHHRRARGAAGTSLAWGLWGDVGMVADEASTAFLARFGVRPLAPDRAAKAIEDALGAGVTALAVADIDWDRFLPTFTIGRPAPLLADLPENARPAAPAGSAATPLAEELAETPAAQREPLLLRHVQAQTAATLGLPSRDDVPPDKPFQELGFDSLTAVQLRNQLNASTGLRLATTLVFDRPTPRELAGHLYGLLVDRDAPTEGSILADLDRWESAAASGQVDPAARRRIAVRMRSLVASWTGGPASSRDDLESATADEMLALISEEFGKS
ncbi:type I polyketide synthase [Actinomadura oligospora]|uniref:type I polyketide synthase n=1 Tax=Actinomadura oligospora TaxID=111804 RepID=UPI0004796D5E|nr:type I polyketide synthase [Actinomadura oligospora]